MNSRVEVMRRRKKGAFQWTGLALLILFIFALWGLGLAGKRAWSTSTEKAAIRKYDPVLIADDESSGSTEGADKVGQQGHDQGQTNASPPNSRENQPILNATVDDEKDTVTPFPLVTKAGRKIPFNVFFPEIDCSTVPRSNGFINIANITFNTSTFGNDQHYMLSVPKWANGGNISPSDLMDMLEATSKDLFIDVGANIGIYTLAALVLGIPTISFEPIEFNIQRVCDGWRRTIYDRNMSDASHVTFLQAAVSTEQLDAVNISRPTESFGKMDQASLFSNTIGVVRRPAIEYESVPMVRLDNVVPQDVSIGLVKIDVQGAEKLVLRGMEGLLNRTKGYPIFVYYEEQKQVLQRAGIGKMGENQAYLESFGYKCEILRADIKCHKPR